MSERVSEKTVGVFCSANELPEKYTNPAREFARLMAQNGFHLVWGGSDTGLMKLIASEVQNAGRRIVGVSFTDVEHVARKNADEMIIAKDLGERKATMLLKSDAFAVLVGGIGTIDEVTEILEHKKHGHHAKPIVFLNTDNFYEGLKLQFQKMKDDGFITAPLEDLVHFSDTPQEAIDYIKEVLEN